MTSRVLIIEELCKAFITLNSSDEVYRFFKDLCTPQELDALAERWRVCKLLHQKDLSYRDIKVITGASLTTIGRVSRFLKNEKYEGYVTVLERLNDEDTYDNR